MHSGNGVAADLFLGHKYSAKHTDRRHLKGQVRSFPPGNKTTDRTEM